MKPRVVKFLLIPYEQFAAPSYEVNRRFKEIYTALREAGYAKRPRVCR